MKLRLYFCIFIENKLTLTMILSGASNVSGLWTLVLGSNVTPGLVTYIFIASI